ncbi:fumarylacetoacetate (FAA) hydrolase [Streptomyces tirandamycinicus]|uniref:Fumarylacetoacetate (FAA) hydrolase n=1 Tax=Streptomyces tirandamycinicus TaxID=2174846 RepID=A0A2S1SV95_9ACTN|nr:fumarylacetoacetate (FAA) hydrolase [Streptomyces tirandamycinicus]AWI30197.1 fumarylacetoacetate (FAA) hydrolase [Streptomyces tirandamycinicus]
MSDPLLFEALYQGARHVGFDRPEPGAKQTLYRVADGTLAAAFIATDGSAAAVRAAVTERSEAISVTSGDPEVRPLPPLLPTATGNALLSGFMGTHKKKWGGRTAPEGEFTPPKWFFKGFGDWVRLPGEALNVPASPVALIEEPEIALVYVNDADGTPHYAGYTFGNDLCDIGLHRRDPGYNPYCKLCDTALAPWLFLGEPPASAAGRVTIERDGATAWEGSFDCGEDALYFRVRDMVGHLFSFPAVRRPGLVNYVLLGADEASFHDGFRIEDGDNIAIDVKSHGVTFDNTVRFVSPTALV